MKNVFVLLSALAFAAPFAAHAQAVFTPHEESVQKVQATYHTNFGGSPK